MKTTDRGDRIPFALTFVCWLLPLFLIAFGGHEHWLYMIGWLVLGTLVLNRWCANHPVAKPEPKAEPEAKK